MPTDRRTGEGPPDMRSLYYIDGYNVIYHCPRLKSLASADFEAARETLIDRVARYCTEARARAKIIFDGRGRRPDIVSPFLSGPHLEVIYSPARQTADALIEREVYEADDRSEIIVVSSDRGIRDLCGGLGALTMRPEHFLSSIEESLQQGRSTLEIKRHKTSRPARIEEHLDKAARQRLQDLRRDLEEKK